MAGLWEVYNVSVKEQILGLLFCRQWLPLCTVKDNKRKIKINGDFNKMKAAVKAQKVQSSLCDADGDFLTLDFMTFRRGVSESGDKQEAIKKTRPCHLL